MRNADIMTRQLLKEFPEIQPTFAFKKALAKLVRDYSMERLLAAEKAVGHAPTLWFAYEEVQKLKYNDSLPVS